MNGNILNHISKDIKVVHEITDAESEFCSEEFREAHDLLCQAKKIYFLGFGFLNDSIRRFKFFSNDTVREREIYSTIVGLGPVKIDDMMRRLSRYGFSRRNFPLEVLECNDFFESIGTLD